MAKKFFLGPLQQEWIRCLRSDEWKQGRSCLCVEDEDEVRYCCLGVACEVVSANGIKIKRTQFPMGEWSFDFRSSFLPESVVNAMNFIRSDGMLSVSSRIGSYSVMSLSEANDRGVSFKSIAEFVEKYPERVFTGPA